MKISLKRPLGNIFAGGQNKNAPDPLANNPAPVDTSKKIDVSGIDDIETLHKIYRDDPNPDNRSAAAGKMQKLTGLSDIVGRSVDELKIIADGKTASDKKQALADTQRKQINTYADEFTKTAATRRGDLASSLAGANKNILDQYTKSITDQGQEAFRLATPGILEDLHSRGLSSSSSEVANANARALQMLANQEQGEVGDLTAQLGQDTRSRLAGFDDNTFNQINDLRGSGLEAMLGGDQSALDAELGSRTSALNRAFDVADQDREQRLAQYMAKKQSRNQLVGSLIGAGTTIAGAAIGGPAGGAIGSSLGGALSSSLGYNTSAPSAYTPGGGYRLPYQNSGSSLGPVRYY